MVLPVKAAGELNRRSEEKMNEMKDKSKQRLPSRWFVAVSSLAISAFAILIGHLYAFQHWRVLSNPDMMTMHGTPAWDRAFPMLIRLEHIRPVTGIVALAFALWAMLYLTAVLRLGVLAVALLALAMSLIVM